VSEAEFEGVLSETLKTSPDRTVILRGDKDVLLGEAVKVISIAKKVGASEIAIAAEAAQKQKAR
jgi:biopolymer transport protein ExbD